MTVAIIAFIAGAAAGATVMSLCAISSNGDLREENERLRDERESQ